MEEPPRQGALQQFPVYEEHEPAFLSAWARPRIREDKLWQCRQKATIETIIGIGRRAKDAALVVHVSHET